MPAADHDHPLSIARPPADHFRVAALHRYHLLDTPACDDFGFLTELATRVCNVPYAFISLVDSDRVWIKSCIGMHMGELPRGESYCSLAVLGDAATEIPDLTLDPRTAGMRLTVDAPYMRMYSSVALSSSDGYAIGTLCVMDTRPGGLEEERRRLLTRLARQVMALIELRASERTLSDTVRELELLATTDELTGLHNRRSLLHRLRFETARAKRFRAPLSAVMIDLDHFKRINDVHGHAAGDQVLADVGRLLRESVRVIDVAGRYGGEELCVILPNTPLDGALKFAETLRLKIAAQRHALPEPRTSSVQLGLPEADEVHAPPAGGAEGLVVTASFGVGSFDHLDIDDAESLLRQADDALFRAKHAGRNRVEGGASSLLNHTERNRNMPTATWNGVVIAQAGDDEVEIVENNVYFPPSAVKREYLQPSEHTSRCPWKGLASYYNVSVDGKVNENAAWYYPAPLEAAGQIKDHIAFWRGVDVQR